MKKFRVTAPVDYVVGHLRYGHYETVIEAEDEKEAQDMIKANSTLLTDGELVIDSYEVEDAGDVDTNDLTITED